MHKNPALDTRIEERRICVGPAETRGVLRGLNFVSVYDVVIQFDTHEAAAVYLETVHQIAALDENRQLFADADEVVKMAERYEKLRNVTPLQFESIYINRLNFGTSLDELVDAL